MANTDRDVAAKVLAGYEEDRKQHDEFVERVNRWYRAYRGIAEQRSKARDWGIMVTPPYAAQIIETMVAALVDPRPRWRLRATARFEQPPLVEQLRMGSRQLELLLNQQRRQSGFVREQRVHRLQGLIAGITATKTSWAFEERDRKRNVSKSDPVYNDLGDHLGNVDYVEAVTETEVARDEPRVEVVDIRQLVWPWNAPDIDRAQRLTHRLYYAFNELKRQECKVNGGKRHEGPCRGGIYHNVDQLKDTKGSAQERAADETDLFRSRPGRDDIEVLEQWYRAEDGAMMLCALGNNKVVLREGGSPYWHGRFPFTVCSGMPQPFQIPGMSDVALIEQLQEMMWTLGSQRLTNLELVNNAIVLLADDMDDPDAFEFYPGARNTVQRPDQVVLWTPDTTAATISLSAEAQLKSDLQSISGGGMWAGGDNSQSRSDTATEASILTNLAQRRVAAKKQFFLDADADVGDQFIALNDQYPTQEQYVDIVGADGMQGWEMIDPSSWREFDFRIELEAVEESLMRTEKRAEAQAKLQVALSAVPVFTALAAAAPGSFRALNPQAFMDDYLDAHDVQDKDRYYSELQQPQLPAPAQQGAPGGGGGATAPQAVDANSPSNAFSQSPVAALQRMGAETGGPNNL